MSLRSFSYETTKFITDQLPCWLTYTNEHTHRIIDENLHRAPMFSGMVKGTGARYCPSIEDKVVRFNDKPRHQIFLSLKAEIQRKFMFKVFQQACLKTFNKKYCIQWQDLENVQMMRPGYAIEYDAVEPSQLWPTLETKKIKNLYTAGQINGTSGYEEAAGQGIMAGINAGLNALGKEELILSRSDAYIGVLIDDLVTKGTNEPYRLLTSRAEYRLLLRHDNADLRLTEKGHDIGLISEERYERFKVKKQAIEEEKKRLKNLMIKPTQTVQDLIKSLGGSELKDGIKAADLLKRTEMHYEHIDLIAKNEVELDPDVKEQVEIQIKYEGYIEKSLQQVERLKKMEDKKIPEDIDYDAIGSLATEARQKLKESTSIVTCSSFKNFWCQPGGYFYFACLLRTWKNCKSVE